jgi:lysophospholipase L1-like esterase
MINAAQMSPPGGEYKFKGTRRNLFCFLTQLLLIAFAATLGVWLQMPLLCFIGTILSGVAATIGGLAEAKGSITIGVWARRIIVANLFLIPALLLFSKSQVATLDGLYALVAWSVGAVIFIPHLLARKPLASNSGEPDNKTQLPLSRAWRQLALVWGFFGGLIWLANSYTQNQAIAFHIGLLVQIGLLFFVKSWFRIPTIFIQLVNTFILLLICLPLVDVFLRPSTRLDDRPESRKRYYSYDAAKKNPVMFTRWWKYYNEQWDQMLDNIAVRDPTGVTPFQLRPGTSAEFFQSHITINSKGFRGKEFSAEKGNTFRIVAIGESTTFGITMNADDKPWPELLEEIIRTRLKPARPVEVINAGVPAHTLQHTLTRLQTEILPLKPDMIICYHGYNGFYLLYDTLPHVEGERPPRYQPRPLKILADVEHRVKMTRYKNAMLAPTRRNPPRAIDPMSSRYALAYQQLFHAARTNNIRLAIATFSMAANSKSDNDILEFYRPGFPAVHLFVQANAVHATMVRQLVIQNPDVDLVDTQPNLDGYHEKFIDLMHLTQEGRQEVAEAFFAGIKKTLQECLTQEPQQGPAVAK